MFQKVENLFFSLFVSEEDHEAVQAAMANMPMMALFKSKSTKKDDTQSRQVKKQREKSMVDDDTQCLAAVNYL